MKALLAYLLLPLSQNNHKPKALHHDALLFYAVCLIIFNIVSRSVPYGYPQILGYATDIYVEQLLASTNAKRLEAGIPALTYNDKLAQAAKEKAQDMFEKNYWAHTSPQGTTPWDFIVKNGYAYSVAGENLAKNFSDSSGVVDAWMASPSHRDNIVKPNYQDVGFAVVNGRLNGEETTLVVQMFGKAAAGSTISLTTPLTNPQPFQPVGQKEISLAPSSATSVNQNNNLPAAKQPVVVGEAISAVGKPIRDSGYRPMSAQLAYFVQKPAINLYKASKMISLAFILALTALLIVDAVIVRRRRIVRVSGRTGAHILFFALLSIGILKFIPGMIL